MTVYLAGPIAGCSAQEAGEWRLRATNWLARWGVKVLDPMRRDYASGQFSARQIVAADKADILQAKVVLANCWKPGWGTAMEILFANERGIPVVCIVPSYRSVSPWIQEHAHSYYLAEYAAIDAAAELCSKEIRALPR